MSPHEASTSAERDGCSPGGHSFLDIALGVRGHWAERTSPSVLTESVQSALGRGLTLSLKEKHFPGSTAPRVLEQAAPGPPKRSLGPGPDPLNQKGRSSENFPAMCMLVKVREAVP